MIKSLMVHHFINITFDSIQIFPFILRMIYFISATKQSKTFFPAKKPHTINNHAYLLQFKKTTHTTLHTRTWVRIVDANSSRASSIFVFFGPPHILCLRTLFPMYFNACKGGELTWISIRIVTYTNIPTHMEICMYSSASAIPLCRDIGKRII